jgi:hypothetical protein
VTTPVRTEDQPRTIGRRRLVRTAATAAWAVPAIQVVSAVPAFAASGCCNIAVTGTGQWRSKKDANYLDFPLTITNGCGTAVTGVSVVLTICGIEGITYAGAAPTGWSHPGSPHDDGAKSGDCYTLTFSTAQTIPANGAIAVTLSAKSKAYDGHGQGSARPAGSATAVATSTGCTSDALSIAIAAQGK